MSRPVCGICMCIYGDDGECACPEQEAQTTFDHMKSEIERKDALLRSVKQETETGLVIGDEIGMRDALTQILKEIDEHLGIKTELGMT